MDKQQTIRVEDMILRFICRTRVLEPYKSGHGILLDKGSKKDRAKGIYKITCHSTIVIFKILACPNDDINSIKELKDEYELSVKAYKAAHNGVIKPMDFCEINDDVLHEYVLESIYEYGGDDLSVALSNADSKMIMEVMTDVASTMAVLEEDKIFHSDIKPENIVIKNGGVKILDFGVYMKFYTITQMHETTA